MQPLKASILIADDEPKYMRSLQMILEGEGYAVITAENGQQAVERAKSERPSLVLLDVRIPVLNGVEACRRIREFFRAPILMFTALGQDDDVAVGLEAGADDYMVKPFMIPGLLARLQTALSWATYGRDRPAGHTVFATGDLRVDFARQQVFMAAREVPLTAAEYRLLCELTLTPGQVVPHEALLENVWGLGHAAERHIVPIFIARLRQKIELNPAAPRYILNGPRMGYLLPRP